MYFSSYGGQKSEIKMSTRLIPSAGSEGESVPVLSPGSLWFAGNPWHSWACWGIIPISAAVLHAFFLGTCLCPNFPLPLKTQIILDLRPTLIQYDLILTNYICKDPISILGFWVDMNLIWETLFHPVQKGKGVWAWLADCWSPLFFPISWCPSWRCI